MLDQCSVYADRACYGCGECVDLLELDPVNKCMGCVSYIPYEGDNSPAPCNVCIEDEEGQPTEYSIVEDCE